MSLPPADVSEGHDGPPRGGGASRSDPTRSHYECDPRWLSHLERHYSEIRKLETYRQHGANGRRDMHRTYGRPDAILIDGEEVSLDAADAESIRAAAIELGDMIWADVVAYTEEWGPAVNWRLVAWGDRPKKGGKHEPLFQQAALCNLGRGGGASPFLDGLASGDPGAVTAAFFQHMTNAFAKSTNWNIATLRNAVGPMQAVGPLFEVAVANATKAQEMAEATFLHRIQIYEEEAKKNSAHEKWKGIIEMYNRGMDFVEGTAVDVAQAFLTMKLGGEPLPDTLQELSAELAQSITMHQVHACGDSFDVREFIALLHTAAKATTEMDAAVTWRAFEDDLRKGLPRFMAASGRGGQRQRFMLAKCRARVVILLNDEQPRGWGL